MTSINSLIRTIALELPPSTQHLTPSNTQSGAGTGTGNSPISFHSHMQNSPVNFGSHHNFLQQPHNNAMAGPDNQSDPLTQLMTLIQDMLQRLSTLMKGQSDASDEPSNSAVTGGGKGNGASGHSPIDSQSHPTGAPQNHPGGPGSPANGNFSEHSLGNQLSVQKSAEDKIGMAHDPERGNVIKVDFNKGHYTEHSTSPRAEIKDGTKLQEGQPYSFKFGMKRESNNDGTFFQVLDHNNAKPSPRAWLTTKNGQYQLHLKTSQDSNAPSKVFNIGKPGDAAKDVGKWADFQIDFKRGIGNGEISVTKNGENVFDKKGISTMFDTHSSDSYAKFGQYRNEGDHKPATSLFSGFSVAKG